MCIKQVYAIRSTYIFFVEALHWNVGRVGDVVCSHGNLGMAPMGCTECIYPTLLKVTVNVSCILNKFGSVKTRLFLGIKKPKTLGLRKQPEQGVSASLFEFCLCSRPFCASTCTQVLEWVEKISSAAFVTCIVKGAANWGTKSIGCANGQHFLSHYPLRMCDSRDAMLQGVVLVCCAVPNSVFGILWSICYIFTLCGKLCSAVRSSYLQEKSFYSKSNLSECWQEKLWVQSIASLSPPFHTGNDSLYAQILSVPQLRSYELKTGIDFSQYCKV